MSNVVDTFDQLVVSGRIGFYNQCEINQVFLLDKDIVVQNVFMLCTMEEVQKPETKTRLITSKPITVQDGYRIGIIRHQAELPFIREQIENWQKNEKWKFPNGDEIDFSDLHPLPGEFIPPSEESTNPSPISSILKNNFLRGSHILEFQLNQSVVQPWAKDKEFIQNIDKCLANHAKDLPLQLWGVEDHIGNLILQFPVDVVSHRIKFSKDDLSLRITWGWHHSVQLPRPIRILGIAPNENSLYGMTLLNVQDSNSCTIPLVTLRNSASLALMDPETGLILGYDHHLIRCRQLNIGVNLLPNRKRALKGNGLHRALDVPDFVEVQSPENIVVGGDKSDDPLARGKLRLRRIERELYEKSLTFMEYGVNNNERTRSLIHIRDILDRFGEGDIGIWDPYLTSDDLIETLFCSKRANMMTRAIADWSSTKEFTLVGGGKVDFETWRRITQAHLVNGSDLNDISLEFRCCYGKHGWGFHDRFLLISEPVNRVWSLGTSLNRLGIIHHIIQEVKVPEQLLDSFNRLWNALNDPSCIVARLPK